MWQLPKDAAVFEVQLPPSWKDDEAAKRLFGIELNFAADPFSAAVKVLNDEIKALWASQNWIKDPVVIEAKAAFSSSQNLKLLDKEGLSLKLLAFADERDVSGRFYISEAKDRLKALDMYAEIQGFKTKPGLDGVNSQVNNFLKVVFVKPEVKNEEQIIEHEAEPIKPLAVNLKLVSGVA